MRQDAQALAVQRFAAVFQKWAVRLVEDFGTDLDDEVRAHPEDPEVVCRVVNPADGEAVAYCGDAELVTVLDDAVARRYCSPCLATTNC